MRPLVAALLLLTGLLLGVASVAVHATWWGLPLAVSATGVTAYAVGGGWTTRMPLVLGWCLPVMVLALPRPDGGFWVAGDVRGWLLLGFGLVLVVTGLTTLPASHRDGVDAGCGSRQN